MWIEKAKVDYNRNEVSLVRNEKLYNRVPFNRWCPDCHKIHDSYRVLGKDKDNTRFTLPDNSLWIDKLPDGMYQLLNPSEDDRSLFNSDYRHIFRTLTQALHYAYEIEGE